MEICKLCGMFIFLDKFTFSLTMEDLTVVEQKVSLAVVEEDIFCFWYNKYKKRRSGGSK